MGDIALVHFSGALPAGFKAASILSAANARNLVPDALVTIAGFGITNGVSKEGAGVLRVASVIVADPQFASSEVKLNQQNGTGACHGDSGGPAFLEVRGKLYLWGVTSRGVDDVKNDCSQFSAYTNILAYKSWVNRMATKLSATRMVASQSR